jgi:hypothetical protein
MPFETLTKINHSTLFSTAGFGENDRDMKFRVDQNRTMLRRGLQELSNKYGKVYNDHFKPQSAKNCRSSVHGLYWKYLQGCGLKDAPNKPDHWWFCTADLYNPGARDGAGSKRVILVLENFYGGVTAAGKRNYTPDGGYIRYVLYTPDHYKTFQLVITSGKVLANPYTGFALGVYANPRDPLTFPD